MFESNSNIPDDFLWNSLEQSWDSVLCNTEVSKLSESEAQPNPKSSDSSGDNCSELKLIKQPSPPPVAAPVQELSVIADLMQLCDPSNSLQPSTEAEPVTALPLLTDNLKQTEAPKALHIVNFVQLFCFLVDNNNHICVKSNSIFYTESVACKDDGGVYEVCQEKY